MLAAAPTAGDAATRVGELAAASAALTARHLPGQPLLAASSTTTSTPLTLTLTLAPNSTVDASTLAVPCLLPLPTGSHRRSRCPLLPAMTTTIRPLISLGV